MERVYIALGSNLDNPLQQLHSAVQKLQQLPLSKFVRGSSIYRSEPLGDNTQPSYLNAIVAIETELSPLELLDNLQIIEQKQGRARNKERWSARSLDLDILLFGQQCMQTERLQIPHYQMHKRAFVLYPLTEIAPQLIVPCGTTLTRLLAHCPFQKIECLSSESLT